MSATQQQPQRSKRGCWTCRLRRKKCFEDGPPCLNCVERDVFCHGYGPKPDWKDKGVKEKREAVRLALSSRRQSRRLSSDGIGDAHGTSSSNQILNSPKSPLDHATLHFNTPMDPDLPSWPLSPPGCSAAAAAPTDQQQQQQQQNGLSMDLDSFLDLSSLMSSQPEPIVISEALHAPQWDPSLGEPADSANKASTSSPSARPRNHDSVGSHGVQADLASLIVSRGHDLANEHERDTLSREYDLVTRFLDDYRPEVGSRDSSRGWLLYLLGRSRAFLQCSLSMAALRESSLFVPGSEPFQSTLQDAYRYRTYAMEMFAELQAAPLTVLGEDLVVATHLAHLEALFQRLPDCQSYLELAALSLNNRSDHQEQAVAYSSQLRHKTPTSAYFRSPQPSTGRAHQTHLETRAVYCFCSLLIWNDAISSSIKRKTAPAAAIYRELLSSVDFSAVFLATTMCEGKAVSVLLDIMALDEWKRERQTRGELSYRNLLDKANDIERSIKATIQVLCATLLSPLASDGEQTLPALSLKSSRNAHVRTYIFLRAALIELHLTVSGGSVRAPEVQECVDSFIAAWEMQKSTMESQSLLWPFCVAGAVAIDAQREFFQAAMAASKLPAMQDLKRLLALCWHEVDRLSSSSSPGEYRSWKDLLPSTSIMILFS
ncbi:ustiloxin B cluster transcription factor ustR [Pseudocercospora fuligena]|uniref:Ustiloxin B cluster transcription factor ustR n=1 Tax=Pseudocercospora fuligena TaxID=685502 RepID=A0A8H6VDP2_9PEZI|nr:ustiloxin B cluster transcription factor ustR [Pseudocercospora fuligena]